MRYPMLFIAACFCFGAARAGGLYWENGDFLVPVPKPGSFALADTGERYGNWRVVGQPGSVAWTSGTYTHAGLSFPAQGTNATARRNPWVNLAAISRTATGIVHNPVATNVGQSYTLGFYVGNIVDLSGVYGSTSTVLVYQNSIFLGSFTNSDGAGTNAENWKYFSITFNATDPNTTVAFINGDGPNDLNCGIDNVTFGPSPAQASSTRSGGHS